MLYKLFTLLVLNLFLFTVHPAFTDVVEGDPAPQFALRQLNTDRHIRLYDMLNANNTRNVVVLSYFDTQCKPCLDEIPKLQKVIQQYVNQPVQCYLVSVDRVTVQTVKDYVKTHNIQIPVLIDQYGAITGETYGVVKYDQATLPMLFVITRNGIIKKLIRGYDEKFESDLPAVLDTLLKEPVRPLPAGDWRTVTILFTNSTNGILESCDCPNNPYGGLVRRATCIKEIRAATPDLLVLDSGDFFSAYPNKLLNQYSLKIMELIGYDAVGLGDQEFILGVNFIRSEIQSKRIPFVSTNLNFCPDEKMCIPLTPTQHISKEVAGYKIGILSITSPRVFTLFPKDKIKGLKIVDPIETVKGYLETYRKEVDLVILLSHSGYEQDLLIAKSCPELDVIVGGHSQSLIKQPVKVGKTLIVQAGEKGQNVGKLTLGMDKNKKIAYVQHQLIPLTKEVPDEPEVLSLLKQYNDEVGKKAADLIVK